MTDTEPKASGSEIAVGDEGPEVVVGEFERKDFVKYAGASGDFHPVHYDDQYAAAAGNPDVFAQGMLTAGIGARFVTKWFGLANVDQYGVRFQKRVFPGDTVSVNGEVTAVNRTEETVEVEADIIATNTDGEVVLSGDTKVSLQP
jgi:acyl dehydratase